MPHLHIDRLVRRMPWSREQAAHPEPLLTHEWLLRRVWGPGYGRESEYLRVYVRQLRQKIEADPERPQYVLTETGIGYRLRAPD